MAIALLIEVAVHVSCSCCCSDAPGCVQISGQLVGETIMLTFCVSLVRVLKCVCNATLDFSSDELEWVFRWLDGRMSAKKSQSLETFATLTIRYSVLTKYTKYSIFCSQWADLFAWNREFFRYSSGKPPWIEKIVYLVDFFLRLVVVFVQERHFNIFGNS